MPDNDFIRIVCTTCGKSKPLFDFDAQKAGKHGRRSKCRDCRKLARADWINANRDRIRELGRAVAAKKRSTADGTEKNRASSNRYYAANKEVAKIAAAKYRNANRLKFNSTIALWRAKNPEIQRASNAAWNAANPEARRIHRQNRRARKLQSGAGLSSGLVAKLFELQSGKCPCCNQPLGEDFHLDHQMPLALGGSNTDGNMQLLRAKCNMQKTAKHPVEFMQSRGFLL